MSATPSSTESRALTLLGQGLPVSTVASALGVTDSAISQLLSNPEFAQAVKDRKYSVLARHNSLDEGYDKLEAALLKKLSEQIPLLFKPREILHAIQVVNGAKRRGALAPESTPDTAKVVPLIIPTVIQNRFITNIHQQVIKAGDQNLTTIQSSQVSKLVESPNVQPEPAALPAPTSSGAESFPSQGIAATTPAEQGFSS